MTTIMNKLKLTYLTEQITCEVKYPLTVNNKNRIVISAVLQLPNDLFTLCMNTLEVRT